MKAIFLIALCFFTVYSKPFLPKEKVAKNGGEVQITDCTHGPYATIDYMDATPEYVTPGDTVRTQVSIVAKGYVYTQEIDVKVTLNGMEEFEDSVGAFGQLNEGDMFDYHYEYYLPSDAKPGKWEIRIILSEISMQPVSCTQTTFDLEP